MSAILAGAPPVCIVITTDAARAVPFYRDVLGLALKRDDGFASVFDAAGIEIRLTTVPDWTPPPHTVLGFAVPDIAATIDALAAKGVTFLTYDGFGQDERGIWTAPGGGTKVAWFNDPDGNNLSLTQA